MSIVCARQGSVSRDLAACNLLSPAGQVLRGVSPSPDIPLGRVEANLEPASVKATAVAGLVDLGPCLGGNVTASGDGTLKVWDAESGDEIYTLEGHRGQVFTPEEVRRFRLG